MNKDERQSERKPKPLLIKKGFVVVEMVEGHIFDLDEGISSYEFSEEQARSQEELQCIDEDSRDDHAIMPAILTILETKKRGDDGESKTDADKLRLLANWFNYKNSDDPLPEVQRDLRRIAKKLERGEKEKKDEG